MMWQPMVFTLGGFILAALMLPTILNKAAKVPIWTSAPTATILLAYTAAFISMGMVGSAAMMFLSAVGWFAISVYRRA